MEAHSLEQPNYIIVHHHHVASGIQDVHMTLDRDLYRDCLYVIKRTILRTDPRGSPQDES